MKNFINIIEEAYNTTLNDIEVTAVYDADKKYVMFSRDPRKAIQYKKEHDFSIKPKTIELNRVKTEKGKHYYQVLDDEKHLFHDGVKELEIQNWD